MNRVMRFGVFVGVATAWAAGSGCVSRDEYLRTDFARRKAVERNEQLERDLADERNKVLALETERESLRRELETKIALIDNLKAENDRLDAFAKKMQGQMDGVLEKGLGPVEVVEVKLPAQLDRALKDFAARHPDMIEYDPKRGAVRWKSDLTFALGSDEVREAAKNLLREFAQIVNSEAASQFEVVVVGHTDNVPIRSHTAQKHPTNWHLSVHRAVSVMFALKGFGVDYTRMGCMGYGEFRPREANPTRGGNEKNRRVEVFLVASREPMSGMSGIYKNPNDGSMYAKLDAARK